MANACSCTSAEMNTSIVQGRRYHLSQRSDLTFILGKGKITLTCTDNMLDRVV